MKICLLIIYSSSKEYFFMKCILEKFYNTYINDDFHFYFTQFRESQIDDVELEDRTIYIKGQETHLNILKKTVKSFELINKTHDYDFCIRTNISTIVDINNLNKFLNSIPKTNIYCGGCVYLIDRLDIPFGVVDKSFFGKLFVQGTSIILSKDIVQSMCNKKDKINYNIIDDVSIGLFIEEYHNNILADSKKNNAKFNFTGQYDLNAVFYRNKHNNRSSDILFMEFIIKNIQKYNN